MPRVKVRKFKGFDASESLIVSSNVASSCENVLIDRGDLCNLLHPRLDKTPPPPSVWGDIIGMYHLSSLYSINNKGKFLPGIFVYEGSGAYYRTLLASELPLDITEVLQLDVSILDGYEFVWSKAYPNNLAIPAFPTFGNFVRVGDWILHLGQFQSIEETEDGFPKPRMFRHQMYQDFNSGEFFNKFRFIGVHPPDRTVFESGNGAGDIIENDYDVAFSFVIVNHIDEVDGNTPVENDVLGFDDIESNITVAGEQDLSAGFESVTYRVYLPRSAGVSYQFFEPSEASTRIVGIYARRVDQEHYYFLQYVEVDGDPIADGDELFYEVTVTKTEEDLTRIGAQTDIIPISGAHDVPKAANHGIFFKNRLYTNVLQLTEQNLVQYSQLPKDNDPNAGRYVNYIEGQFPVGKPRERCSGFVEQFGQLIIFKESETWVLTDDILFGELRILFPNRGSVNRDGGGAYISHDNVIFWVDKDGVYAYNGSEEPRRISDPIQKELDRINRVNYNRCRLSVDPRYNHLYLTFPKSPIVDVDEEIIDIPTYIYHIDESGDVWTKTSPIYGLEQVIATSIEAEDVQGNIESERTVYYVKKDRLLIMNPIEKDSDLIDTLIWSWRSGILFMGDEAKRKHFRLLNLIVKTVIENITYRLLDDVDNVLSTENKKEEWHIGVKKERIKFEMGQITGKAFRIGGFDIVASLLGVR